MKTKKDLLQQDRIPDKWNFYTDTSKHQVKIKESRNYIYMNRNDITEDYV